jgi:hypothetical protein
VEYKSGDMHGVRMDSIERHEVGFTIVLSDPAKMLVLETYSGC